MFSIKNITPDEAEDYWSLRLEALRNNPEAFGATYEESVGISIETVQSRIGSSIENYILGAYTESNSIVGMIGFKREQSIKTKHKGFLWGMYISPAYRNQGVGRSLLEEVLRRSRILEGLEQINLCVVTSNKDARNLYIHSGFEVYGLEKDALIYKGKRFDEEHMVYRLKFHHSGRSHI